MCECCSGLFKSSARKAPTKSLSVLIRTQDVRGMELYKTQLVNRLTQPRAADLVVMLKAAVAQGNADAMTKGKCPLHEAVRIKDKEVVQELMKAKASPEAKDAYGKSPIQLAKETGCKALQLVMERAQELSQNASFEDALRLLPKVPLFARLRPDELPRLAAAFTSRSFPAGAMVIRQGEPGNDMFIIQSGQVKVLIENADGSKTEVNQLGPRDHFGEAALINDAPRNASIQAIEPLSVKCLARGTFQRLDLKQRLNLKRKAVRQDDEALTGTFKSAPATLTAKQPAERQLVEKAMRDNQHLGPLLANISTKDVGDIVDKAYAMEVEASSEVIKQGDFRADNFYVVQSGNLAVFKDQEHVCDYSKGDSFGELALLFRAPRAATVIATSKARLWCLSRQELRTVMQAQVKKKLEDYATMLEKVKLLEKCTLKDRQTLADALVETTYYKDEYIIRQGDEGDTFFILYSGEVVVEINGQDVQRITEAPEQKRSSGDNFFGERALLENVPRKASIRVVSKKAIVLALHRDVFVKVVQPGGTGAEQSKTAEGAMVQYNFDKLEHVGLLGSGGFGKVTLVKCGTTGSHLALKAISKGHLIAQQQQASVMNEKLILRMTSSSFLVSLAATFNGRKHLYFLMEPAMGGELFTIYQKKDFYGSKTHARFYVGCVLFGLEHLHQRMVIYRDMKPENLLLDNRGYCKITDFGLAKFVIGHTYTTCGTPDYFAPEMVAGVGHTVAVDWWTLGILLFELVSGDTPFRADDTIGIFRRVKRGIDAVNFPFKGPEVSLVKGLCKTEPSERLPMRSKGVKHVQEHEWFNATDFSWTLLNKRAMPAPYLPKVKSPQDLSNFDIENDDGPPELPYHDPGDGWDLDFEDKRGPVLSGLTTT